MERLWVSSIPSGSIVFLKKMTPEEIIPGLEYVIVCQKIITLRIVRTSERDSEWRLVAADRGKFQRYFRQGFRYRAGISGRGQVGN